MARLSSAGLWAAASASSEHLFDLPARFGRGLALIEADELRREPDLLPRLLEEGIEVVALGDLDELPEDVVCGWLQNGVSDFLPDSLPPKLWSMKVGLRLGRLLPSSRGSRSLACGHIRIDLETRAVWTRRGKVWRRAARLTRTELELLGLFVRHPGKLLERPFILGNLWKLRAEAINSETVNKHIQAIRRKLGPAGKTLDTVFGAGYILREPS